MRHARKQPETVADAGQVLEAMRDLVDTVTEQMEAIEARFPAREPMPPSPRIALHHAKEALKYARGLPAPPVTRQRIQSAYRLVCAELGVDE